MMTAGDLKKLLADIPDCSPLIVCANDEIDDGKSGNGQLKAGLVLHFRSGENCLMIGNFCARTFNPAMAPMLIKMVHGNLEHQFNFVLQD